MVEYVIAKISVSLYAGAIIFKVVLGVSSQWVSAVCILVATALYTYPPSRSFTITPLLMWSSHFTFLHCQRYRWPARRHVHRYDRRATPCHVLVVQLRLFMYA